MCFFTPTCLHKLHVPCINLNRTYLMIGCQVSRMKSWLPPTSTRCWNLDSLPSQANADFKPSEEDWNHRRKPSKSDWKSDVNFASWEAGCLQSTTLKHVVSSCQLGPSSNLWAWEFTIKKKHEKTKTSASIGMSSSLFNFQAFQGCLMHQSLHESCEKVNDGFEWNWGNP